MNFRKFWIIPPFLILLEIISACSIINHRSKDIEEEAVYSALINANPTGYLSGSPVLIAKESIPNAVTGIDYLSIKAPTLKDDTLSDYISLNRQIGIINLPLKLDESYTYFSIAEFAPLIMDESWEKIHQKYPETKVYTSFSKIGFSHEIDQALVYMLQLCGSKCGVGNLYLMIRTDDGWKIESTVELIAW
jgi:hypothetical protein